LSGPPALAGGHGLLVDPGFEVALAGELAASRGMVLDGPRWPALLTSRRPLPPVDPAFALQQLPELTRVEGDSPAALAEAALAVVQAVTLDDAAFTLHAGVPEPRSYRSLATQATQVGQAFLERLRPGLPVGKAARPWQDITAADPAWPATVLVQLMLVGRRSLLVSAARPRPLPAGGFDLAPWPAGRAPVVDDRRAPSRAYRKLREGLAWLGSAPAENETCVDLGGSPGGWAHVALAGGARVVAVDRAPLAPALLAQPRLQMVTGNAFTYTPADAVDWLLCDVICEPRRTIELVDSWMREGRCRRVVATLKFKGDAGYDAIADAHARLSRHRWPFLRIKHLANHHNEAVILGRAR
jgi:hypothetical protein